jgi:hypothetical protein
LLLLAIVYTSVIHPLWGFLTSVLAGMHKQDNSAIAGFVYWCYKVL